MEYERKVRRKVRRKEAARRELLEKIQKMNKESSKGLAILGTSFLLGGLVVPQSKAQAVSATGEHFFDKIGATAQDLAAENDLYASVMMAQAALESAWGTSALASAPNNNLFGVKGNYNGQTAQFNTLEDSGNQNYYSIVAGFRVYPTYRESLQDYVTVVKQGPAWNQNLYSGAWRSNTNSYADATQWLTGRYATDTAYAQKLNRIIETYDLTRFDSPDYVPTPIQVPTAGTVTVAAGDTLYRIATRNGMTVAQLKAQNQLTSDVIYVGQRLFVQAVQPTRVERSSQAVRSDLSTRGGYTVQPGDNLYRIARNHNVSVAELKQANGLSGDVIYVGQRLVVTNSPVLSVTTSEERVAPATTSGTYVVALGDNLYRIARNHNISVAELKQANGLSNDVIYVGQRLQVKNRSVSASQPQESAASDNATSGSGTYRVVAGDTLYRIANRFDMSVAQLKARNGLSSDTISVGQQLAVSGVSESSYSAPSEASAGSYTVQAGDTLYRIANRFGMSVAQLKAHNGLSSDTISVGQQLVVSGVSESSYNAPSEASTGSYTVQVGDTLFSIYRKTGVSVDRLQQLNQLAGTTIQPGQVLRLS